MTPWHLRRRLWRVVDLPKLIVDYSYAFRYAGQGLAARVTRQAPENPVEGPQVLVLTGVWEPYAYISPVVDTLRAAGFRTHKTPRISLNLEDVDVLADRVARMMEHEGLSDVVIVAHSKGGLTAKQLLIDPRTSGRIRGVVALCTPFGGSDLALIADGLPGVGSLATNSEMIERLDEHPEVNHRIVSIFPGYDPVVPRDRDRLEGAENIEIPGYGHFRMLTWPRAVRELVGAVARLHGADDLRPGDALDSLADVDPLI